VSPARNPSSHPGQPLPRVLPDYPDHHSSITPPTAYAPNYIRFVQMLIGLSKPAIAAQNTLRALFCRITG
jgi:hypothetical protein